MANKIAMLVSEAMNSNAVINTCLGVSFVVLGVRSDKQQKYVEALQEQKDSLSKSNKEMKVQMWEWKQQLFAEAASAATSAVVPLSTLKAIYGEVTTQSGHYSFSFLTTRVNFVYLSPVKKQKNPFHFTCFD